ncbi:MAG TPA: type VI secretion system membrane subunit TssM, partial [Stellaceae bacterium]|nr:type VI secretion system membrane subunit TssM [Stellaceae bacterium]
SRLDPAAMLRGFYFTSGTQAGTPIDRLTAVLARSFGMDQQRAPSLRPEQGRSYFLGRLIKEVVFGEAMLVSERPGAVRRRLLVRAGAFAAIALVVLVGGGLLLYARSVNEAHFDEMNAALAAYEKTAAGLPLDPVAEADLPRVLPLLDAARALPHGYDHSRVEPSSWLQFGLSQDAKLRAGARSIYRHAVERVLLPRLIWRLEAQMHSNLSRPDFLYEATRVYLMLGNAGPLDRDLVRAWMSLDWQGTYPGAVMAPLRDDLARHLDALLANPLPSVPLDGALVEAARATFSRVPLANRVYSRIAPSAAAQAVPPWRPSDALGAAGTRVFVRNSGKKLSDGIPGFYTVKGFYTVLLPALGNATKQVASESWVLGTRAELAPDSAGAQRLEHDVIALYEAEYAKEWDAMLSDLSLVPLRSPDQAVQDLYILASPQSPMRDLLASVARQLTLSQPPPAPPGSSKTEAAKGAAKGAATESATTALQRRLPTTVQLRPLLATQAGAPPPEPPGKAIDERYKALRDYVGSGPGAPIDQTLKVMDGLRQQLAQLAAAPAPGAAAPAPSGEDAALLLRAEAAGAPQPVKRWLEAMVASATAVRTGSTVDQVKKAFNASGGPAALCRQAVTGRYPFSPGSANDIPLDDFARLFAPGGLIDAFFNTQLRPYVDISGPAWKGQPVEGVPPPVAPAELAQFQRAAAIRDLFFGAGGNVPTLHFDLTPRFLDAGAKQVTLDLGSTKITYAHGATSATQVTWPGATVMSTVRLTFDPPPAGGGGELQASGPWALFRLFDQGNLQRAGSAERYQLTFRSGEREAVFELRAGSVQNPFARGVLRDFRCPNM